MDLFKMCLHLDEGLNHEFEPVCYQCGLILGSPMPSFNHNESSKYSYEYVESCQKVRTFLWDCCDCMHIPKAVTTSILTEFNSFQQKSLKTIHF